MSFLRTLALAVVAFATVHSPQTASAQENVVRIVVPFAPGNALDASARALAESLAHTLQRTVIVDNKPGAGGVIGTAEVARAKPDGSVLLFNTGGFTTNAVLYRKLPYDVQKDFSPITQLGVSPGFVLLVRADSPYKTMAQLLHAARAKPGTISYGSWGTGGNTHLIGELFDRATGVRLVHVPYKGSPLNDFLGGHVELTWLASSLALPLLQDGKVRALAIAHHHRWPSMPDVPTLTELGIKEVDLPAWSGLWGPAGMSPALVQSLHRAAAAAMKRPEYTAAMKVFESTPVALPPDQFAALLDAEVKRYKRQIGPLNIQLD